MARIYATSCERDGKNFNTVPKRLQAQVRAIIEAEDKSSPHSDEKLSELLRKEGFPVARRTVAKYRGAIGIPGASERRV